MHPHELTPAQRAAAENPDGLPGLADAEFTALGRRARRVEGLRKSTGREIYTDDIVLPGMLHGKILRSTEAHARIVSIDTAEAEALEGVYGVITGRDLPTPYGIIPWTRDEHALCVDKVRFIGDAVAAVAAVDEDTANAALERIHVEYAPLAVYLSPEESLTPEAAAEPIHAPRKPGANGNVLKHVHLEFGDVDAQMAEADVTIEGEYFFHGTTHTPIEPHCAISRLNPDGVLEVWSSTQVPHYLQRELARVLDHDVAKVRVAQPAVGGAFGGKSEPFDLEFCVALLAMRTGRPVKILYTREELFYSHRGRHPMRMKYRLGASRGGKLKALDAHTILDGGAYASFGLVTTYYSGQLLTAPCHIESYRFDSRRVYTNVAPCGPKRGHGSVQPRFAYEISLDKLAGKLGLDPFELRRRNFMGTGRTVNEFRVRSNGFLECLEAVERASDWKTRYRRLPTGRGLGMAASSYISGTNYPIYPNEMPQAAVQVQVERSGRVAILHGASEIGQGSDSTMAYIACEELGVPLEYVRVFSADTDLTPVDLGAYSSRETVMVGNACLEACRALRGQVTEAVGEVWGVAAGRVRLARGWSFDVDAPEDADRRIPISEAFNIRRGEVRSAGRRRLLRHAEGCPRRLPRRHDRIVARLLLHGARGRSRGRGGHGGRRREEHLGGARLRPRAQPGARRRPDRGLRLHGIRGGDLRGAAIPRGRGRGRPAHVAVAPRLPHPHLHGLPRVRSAHRRVGGSGRPLRREGGGGGSAAPIAPRDRQRNIRRGGGEDRRTPIHTTARMEGPARARRRREPRGRGLNPSCSPPE